MTFPYMDDFPDAPILSPKESLEKISHSESSKAQKLLLASLITQSRVFEHKQTDSDETLLILDVTHFLNHRINTKLMAAIGAELAEKIASFNPELILTAPSSGNIPAVTTALHLPHKPDVIYAPKGIPITMKEVYQAKSRSYSYARAVDLTVSKDCLPKGSSVAVCDDFLDTGITGVDLNHIVEQAEGAVVVFFFVIEKPFGGRERLKSIGFDDTQIISLIQIESMRTGKLKIAGFDVWFELMRK